MAHFGTYPPLWASDLVAATDVKLKPPSAQRNVHPASLLLPTADSPGRPRAPPEGKRQVDLSQNGYWSPSPSLSLSLALFLSLFLALCPTFVNLSFNLSILYLPLYILVCIYIYVYLLIDLSIYRSIRLSVHTYIHTCIQKYTDTYIYMFTVCVHACASVEIVSKCVQKI